MTPEVVIGGKDFIKGAITVPGPATEPFQKIAQDHGTHLVLGVRERDGDAVRNSAVLIAPDGEVRGVYRKGDILAWNEGDREVITATLPGEDGYRLWNGGDFKEVTFMLRRPGLYGVYSDKNKLGPLLTEQVRKAETTQ